MAESTEREVRELTARAIAMGLTFGVLFGAANAYLGLRVGMTVATSIPIAVMTVAALRVFGARATILEANLAQTIGSASSSLATGAIFTLPALYMWGAPPSYLQVAGLALCGAVLGVSAMIPLRRLLIVRSQGTLPYPEGRACAEVLEVTTGDRARGGTGAWIFYGIVLGAVVKVALELLRVAPGEATWAVPSLTNGELAIEIAPALIGVGYILGYRQSAVCVSGGLISALLLVPTISTVIARTGAPVPSAGVVWKEYVRFIGTGAVACAGIVTVVRGLPAMAASFRAVVAGLRGGAAAAAEASGDRTDRDVPPWVVVAGIVAVVVAVAAVPGLLAGDLPVHRRAIVALGVGLFGVVFVAVASRIVGIVGTSSQPTSGMTLVTLLGLGLVFTSLGWTSDAAKLTLLTAGTIVATAASKAGDISQDLKTGHLVGATPARQQLGQYLGAATACWMVAATILFLGMPSLLTGETQFGTPALPAPQATLMKTVITGQLDGTLSWELVLAGAGLAAGAMLAGVEGLAFAIGVYLPLGAMMPLFVGGLARRVAEGRRAAAGADDGAKVGGARGTLAASGLVAGEGLAGVVIAILVGGVGLERVADPRVDGVAGTVIGGVIVAATVALLWSAGRRDRA